MIGLSLADRTVTTDRPAFVMGIVNATPDSFYEESRVQAGSLSALDRALRLIDEGADILDIGGESTRPGASYVDAEEEIRRVLPLVRQIRACNKSVVLSVDTRKAAVMREALDAGADMLNDVSALEDDEAMAVLCAEAKIPVVLMHKRGGPRNMQDKTSYGDVVREVSEYLSSRAQVAGQAGIAENKIIIDPGIGFGKGVEENISLIRNCGSLCAGRYPVLMALSRKSVIGSLLSADGQAASCPAGERLYGTLAADMLAVLSGARLIRVHDVKPAVDTMTALGKIGYTGAIGK